MARIVVVRSTDWKEDKITDIEELASSGVYSPEFLCYINELNPSDFEELSLEALIDQFNER